jgi:hypothetical protein
VPAALPVRAGDAIMAVRPALSCAGPERRSTGPLRWAMAQVATGGGSASGEPATQTSVHAQGPRFSTRLLAPCGWRSVHQAQPLARHPQPGDVRCRGGQCRYHDRVPGPVQSGRPLHCRGWADHPGNGDVFEGIATVLDSVVTCERARLIPLAGRQRTQRPEVSRGLVLACLRRLVGRQPLRACFRLY